MNLHKKELDNLVQYCSIYMDKENTDLLNLHSQQQQKIYPSEKGKLFTGWMIALVNALHAHLDEETTSHLLPISDEEFNCDKPLGDKCTTMHENVPVLTCRCPLCDTRSAADREHFLDANDNIAWKQLYTNNAQYLKAGQNLCVDHSFSKAVMNGIFSFHASSQAYTQFWNNSYGSTSSKITY